MLGGTLGWGDGLARPDQQDAYRKKPKQWRKMGDKGRPPPAGIVETSGSARPKTRPGASHRTHSRSGVYRCAALSVTTSASSCSNVSFISPLVLPEAIAASSASFDG